MVVCISCKMIVQTKYILCEDDMLSKLTGKFYQILQDAMTMQATKSMTSKSHILFIDIIKNINFHVKVSLKYRYPCQMMLHNGCKGDSKNQVL